MNNEIRHIAIVLAGGKGSRMNSTVPKQYMRLLDKPVLYYSLKKIDESFIDDIIVVCGPGDKDYCRRQIVEPYGFTGISAIVPGGKERYDSVYNGLEEAVKHAGNAADCYVYIHDGARPCIDEELLSECKNNVEIYNACVPAVPVKDTIKVVDREGFFVSTPDRAFLVAVQTPQCFRLDYAWNAYSCLKQAVRNGENIGSITDDAMVVSQYGNIAVRMCKGSYNNIKITTPEDMEAAAAILKGYQDSKLHIKP